MRKIVLGIALAALLTGPALAQDTVWLESADALGNLIHLSQISLMKVTSDADREEASLLWQPALHGDKGIRFVSFELPHAPGMFLRVKDLGLTLEPNDGSAQFALDASFRVAFDKGGSESFESLAAPGYFIRHRGLELHLEQTDGSEQFKADTLFFRTSRQ